ncbi:hypothetical protein EVB55_243 [Rhizobium phage RHph_Y68]|uniref:Uncharacterized protein n=1 Tax=Rhizobium phage RHph_Y68 TaxID=2509787 RepID=A0A7S5USG3_9CAUD|nr:hypothetical protein PP934_gp243 [Rhizobium phage RHph_Y68]QIG68178.1 hypothetical protein EVB55_243 [Rhizobium phage RHph_Y68]
MNVDLFWPVVILLNVAGLFGLNYFRHCIKELSKWA